MASSLQIIMPGTHGEDLENVKTSDENVVSRQTVTSDPPDVVSLPWPQ